MPLSDLTLADVQSLDNELRALYDQDGPESNSFTILFARLSSTTNDVEVFLGALVFALEIPLSQLMYKTICDKPNFAAALLEDEPRLVYLFTFYKFIKDDLPDNYVQDTQWESKEDLEEAIFSTLKKIRDRDKHKISQLVQGAPNIEVLREYIAELPEKYNHASKSRWFQNADREVLLQFVKFIHQTSQNSLLVLSPTEESEIRFGLILLVLLHINNQYRVFSPKGNFIAAGSMLFKECLLLLNVENMEDLRNDQKLYWLRKLSEHICNINRIHTKDIQLDEEKTTLLQTYSLELENYINDLEKKIFSKAIDLNMVSKTSGAIAKRVTPPLSQSMIAMRTASMFTAIGMPGLLFLPAYLVLFVSANKLSHKLYSAIVNSAIDGNKASQVTLLIYSKIINKVGDVVGGTAAGIVKLTMPTTTEGFRSLRAYMKPEDEIMFQRWVDTLLEMPNTLVSEKEKASISIVLGIGRSQEPKLTFLNEEESRVAEGFSI